MPLFAYKALASNGSVTSGEIDATDRPEALRMLDKKGLQPVNLKEASSGISAKKANGSAKAKADDAKATKAKDDTKEAPIPDGPIKLKRAEVVLFTEELSDMLSAGLQLEPALKSMENRQELGNLKAVSFKIRQIVRDGVNFSVALKKVSPSFGPLYCSLAAAGEASGALDDILKRQAHYLKTLAELQARLILAMIYPAFLVVAGIGVSIVFVTTLIPQLTSLIKSSGGEIPLGAAILIWTSNFLSKWWLVIVLTLVAAFIFFKAWKDNDANKPAWDRIKLRLPLIGPVITSRFYVQFLETMANLVGNGLPLLRALELSRDATENRSLRGELNKVIDQVGDGRSFSKALIRNGHFPPLLIDMISVGEQTGKIDQSLRRAAERYDKEQLDKDLQRIMALVMPVVLIIMAGLIGTMAYLMITSIFQTMSKMK